MIAQPVKSPTNRDKLGSSGFIPFFCRPIRRVKVSGPVFNFRKKRLLVKQGAGFTLVEILVVVSIISLISSVVFVRLYWAMAKARFVRIEDDMRQIATAASLYYQDNGKWATDTDLATTPDFVTQGYLAKWPSPPCSEWSYDWDNYSVYSPNPGSAPLIRVTVRPNRIEANNDPFANPSILYYCVEDGLKDGCQWDDPSRFPAGWGGGIDFRLYKNQGITCREGKGWVTNANQPNYGP